MISDVLFEAKTEIDRCLCLPFGYDGPERVMIEALRDHMIAVQKWLDTPPEQTVNVKTVGKHPQKLAEIRQSRIRSR